MTAVVLCCRMLLASVVFSVSLARLSAVTTHPFSLQSTSEVIATIAASCERCDWSVPGREAVVLQLSVDGRYSQHLVLTRGAVASEYRVQLGTLPPGSHQLSIAPDAARSASDAGEVHIDRVEVAAFDDQQPEFFWLSHAPILRARPGTLERFSDIPLLMYVEQDVAGESGSRYSLQYTVIFTNEDGGTPTDRLMATWGRTTDIEFVYGLTDPDGPAEIQAEGHTWTPFHGPREGTHPMLWVSTTNNMVADHGPEDLVRFAPAPQLVSLAGASRERLMDDNPWTYAVTSAEMLREHRVDPAAKPGSGTIVDPRRYVTIEACAQVQGAALAFDVGVPQAGDGTTWLPTDTDPHFRIERGGCFRASAPLPAGVSAADVTSLRIRAYPRAPRDGESSPLAPSVTLNAVTKLFMLDERYTPTPLAIAWKGSLPVGTDGTATPIPVAPSRP